MNYKDSQTSDSVDSPDLDLEPIDEQLLITREFTHVDSSDCDLHRLGYYWPAQVAALPLVR